MFCLLLIALFLAGCGQQGAATRLPGAIPRTATVALPTGAPTVEPSPVNTRVMPTENFTPGPTPTITPIPDEVRGLVVDVLSGDTILVVMDGDPPGLTYEVRYIGIEAPPRSPDNAWGTVAYEINRQLIGMKVVRLVRDEQDFDDQGRLLRYVYSGNDMMSVAMVEQGLARAAISEPNTAFREEILAAEARAQEASVGLWGPLPTATATRAGAAPPTTGSPSRSTSTPSSTTTGTPAAATTTPGSDATGTPAAGDDATPPAADEEPAATETPEQ
jgi:endonuclease YncB( thermonuclease family)